MKKKLKLDQIDQEHIKINDFHKNPDGRNFGLTKYILKLLKYSLIVSNEKLDKIFSKNEDLEKFFHYLIWDYYYCEFKIRKRNNIDWSVEFFDYINSKKEEIFKDKNLQNYQKAKILRFFYNGVENHCNGMKQYLNTIKEYYFFKDV